MARLIEYQVPVKPTKDHPSDRMTKRGYVMLLYVGNVQQRFVGQLGPDGAVSNLVHLPSGMVVGSIAQVKALNFRSYRTMSDREAAMRLINSAVVSHGADEVNRRINKAPVINHQVRYAKAENVA